MSWDWLPQYMPLLIKGLWMTCVLLVLSMFFGMLLAVPVGLLQVTGPRPLAFAARAFCTVMRGTPLLIQVWLLYYGLGTLFPKIPELRNSIFWPVLREGFFYAVLAFSLNVAGYVGEVMRGAFLSVPRGELEAARAYGMPPFKLLMRIWLPRAVLNVLPTLAGETVLMLQSTPLAATITVLDLMGVVYRIRQATYLTYEPLLLLSAIYLVLTFLITRGFGYLERLVPVRR
jgi:polar amino acid transport system permease protein